MPFLPTSASYALHSCQHAVHVLVLIFITWWLNQVIVLLLFVFNTSRYRFNASHLHHIAVAALITAYKDHRGAACPSKSGCQINPNFSTC
jgi:hypothetical protein